MALIQQDLTVNNAAITTAWNSSLLTASNGTETLIELTPGLLNDGVLTFDLIIGDTSDAFNLSSFCVFLRTQIDIQFNNATACWGYQCASSDVRRSITDYTITVNLVNLGGGDAWVTVVIIGSCVVVSLFMLLIAFKCGKQKEPHRRVRPLYK